MDINTINKKWPILYVFIFATVLVVISYNYWDIALAYYCKYELNDSIRIMARSMTKWGDAKWHYAFLIASYILARFIINNKLYSRRVMYILFSLMASGVINSLFKWIAGRHRPRDYFNHDYYGFSFFGFEHEVTSFPSGHTSVVFSVAAAVSILFPRYRIPAFIFAGWVGITRVLITSHYLSDIIAGAAVGIFSATLVKHFFDLKKIRLEDE